MCKDLDDTHGGVAVWTDEGRVHVRMWFTAMFTIGVRHFFGVIDPQKLTCPVQTIFALCIGVQSVVSDAVEAFGQDMDQEATDEL